MFLIGLTDSLVEGKWVYASSMLPVQNTDWNHGEPNNSGNEDCVDIEPSTGKWADIPCNRRSKFICEKPF
ncbi:hypothetical protein FSP39_000896 [Pinctada imbricata]|uniref:C-type lectin domain-containing protein n=1 Tax=Pinctada imbricata TaxID=66713 RepID=A0AA88XIV5_PINIB|nr:hypothetical protein FSP39_000896 [Pinctada imbricata]